MRARAVGGGPARARSAQLVAHAIPTEIQYLRVYSTGIQSVILLLPRKSQQINQYEKSIPSISLNSHSDSESPTESGHDGGSNAKKRLETAAAEPVCGENLQLLGSMDARRDADAG